MKADEFRTMLDRFHVELVRASQWATDRSYAAVAPPAVWVEKLDQLWRDLDRECALMEDAERRLDTDVTPTRSLSMSLPSVNAEAIGKLQAKVARLEGYVDSLRNPWSRDAQRLGDAKIRLAHLEGIVKTLEALNAVRSVPE